MEAAAGKAAPWPDPSNWDAGIVPGPGDDGIIGVTGVTVTHDSGSDFVNSLTINDGLQDTLVLSGGTLSLASTSVIGTWSGRGNVTRHRYPLAGESAPGSLVRLLHTLRRVEPESTRHFFNLARQNALAALFSVPPTFTSISYGKPPGRAKIRPWHILVRFFENAP
jgi:hypothetical protein